MPRHNSTETREVEIGTFHVNIPHDDTTYNIQIPYTNKSPIYHAFHRAYVILKDAIIQVDSLGNRIDEEHVVTNSKYSVRRMLRKSHYVYSRIGAMTMAYENGKLVLIGGEALRKTLRELAKRSVKYYDNVTLNKQQWFEIYADIFGAIKDEIKRQMDWDIYIEPAHAEPTTNLHETIIEQVYKEGPRSCMSNNISNVLNTFYAHSSKEKGNVFIVYAVNSSDTIVARGLAFITDDEKVVVLNDTYAQVNNNIFRKLAMNKLKEYFVDADAVVSVHTFNEDYEKTISVKVAPNPGCCGEYIVPYIDGFARIEEASSCLVLGGSKELIYDTEAYTDTDSHGLTALYGSKDFDVITINGDYVSANYATWEPQADGTWGWEEECD